MPELPEVEITARRLTQGVAGAEIESALAPGMVTMKTFDPPLDALAGLELAGVRRVGKMLAIEAGELAVLVHLMSAGRLQLYDKRASLRDRSSRLLVRIGGERELRLREFGTQQRAWAKLMRADEVAGDEAVATLGPDALPVPPLDALAAIVDQPRHLHPLLRDQRTIAGIGRSWVDEILWTARLSPFQRGSDLDEEAVGRLHAAIGDVLGAALDALRGGDRGDGARQAPDAAEGAQAPGRGLPALRHAARGDPLQGLRDELLPRGADRRPCPEGQAAVEAAQVAAVPAATLGDSFRSFFDAVDEFVSNLASVRLGPLLLACVFFTAYLTLRARASYNILRAAYPSESFRFIDIWGAYFAGYGFNAVVPARGGDVVRLFLTRSAIPNASYPAVGASFVVEAGFDVAMGSLILLFAFSQGVFPKPPDFAKLNAFDLSYLAAHPRFALFLITVAAVAVLVGFALLSARARAFWDRVKQGFTILRDRRRYFREVFGVQLGGWCFRFAAFWMLLDAFRVGRVGEERAAGARRERGGRRGAVHAAGGRRGAGAAREGLRRHRCRVHGRGLLGGAAGRDRRAHVRDRLRRARVHLPRAQLQGGDPAGPGVAGGRGG